MRLAPGGCALALVSLALAPAGAAAAATDPMHEPGRWLAEKVGVLVKATAPEVPHHPVAGPVDYGESGARFGAGRSGHMHEGQDVFAPAGTPLVAMRDSVVVESGSDGGRGNYVALYAPAARQTFVYLHMQAPTAVAIGEPVRAGRQVGALGCTGSCFGDHLHFEVRAGRGAAAPPTDPLPMLIAARKRG